MYVNSSPKTKNVNIIHCIYYLCLTLSAGFDALGTIIANSGTESRANLVTSGELSHVFHLVRPEADEGDDSVEKRGKIMSEVFLTRLLSTKVHLHVHHVHVHACAWCTCTCIYMYMYIQVLCLCMWEYA